LAVFIEMKTAKLGRYQKPKRGMLRTSRMISMRLI